MTTEKENDKARFGWPNAWRAGVIAIVLGLVSSAMWDLMLKPGLSVIGRSVITAITFGSERLRDASYESAALDPTSLSPLVLLTILAYVPLLGAALVFIHPFAERTAEKLTTVPRRMLDEAESQLAEIKITLTHLRKKSITFRRILIGYLCVIGLLTGTSVTVVQQAVLIWRVFHANLAICAPYITEQEHKIIKGRFAAIKTRNDYSHINEALNQIATKNNVSLLDTAIW
jgi:hypothetical protein